eukprot:TRINITY_DN114685_c0_g1_i1.p1 TRINITY_DN114685_c0_g1~~TRINITY_DN114685_c0_g1_i1.p1  ORF type:complete len:253 (+),score=69.98 TRINITY_DN114685_c0_g1_i1:71-829(+)
MPKATYKLVEAQGKDPAIGILTLDDGRMNSFDFEMISEVNALLEHARTDASKALVLTGTSKALSAGFDLKIMGPAMGKPGDKAASLRLTEEGGRLAMTVFGFPKPVVVAAANHGLALGAILLLAGDVRFGPKGTKAKFGLNEVAIGLLLPEFGWKLAQYRLKNTEFTRAVNIGTIYDAEGGANVGYLDELIEGDVLEAAIKEAKRIAGSVNLPVFASFKHEVRGSLIKAVVDNVNANVAHCFGQAPTQSSKL